MPARTPRHRRAEPQRHRNGLFKGYSEEYQPLTGYAGLIGIFAGACAVTALIATRRSEPVPERLNAGDIALLGVATHKLTRIVTKDWVTSPLRAPFAKYEASTGGGEVKEQSRGSGMRQATGDLLTCPWCSGPWVAGGLTASWLFWPRFTRIASGVLAAVTVSDFLHHAYDKTKKWAQ